MVLPIGFQVWTTDVEVLQPPREKSGDELRTGLAGSGDLAIVGYTCVPQCPSALPLVKDLVALPGLLERRMNLRRKILSTGHNDGAMKLFHSFVPYLSHKSRKL